jgi:hypothetical protein
MSNDERSLHGKGKSNYIINVSDLLFVERLKEHPLNVRVAISGPKWFNWTIKTDEPESIDAWLQEQGEVVKWHRCDNDPPLQIRSIIYKDLLTP